MKKKTYSYIPLLFSWLFLLLGGCAEKEDILFDHELPQFELKSEAILLEVIVPQGTKADEKIYIAGPFNGGAEAVGQLEWQLEKASATDSKWGIYLNPTSFKDGKTLADGFYFVSDKQGAERTVKNEEAWHHLKATVGTRTNLYLARWEAYFAEEPEEEEKEQHDGHVIYVEDQTGWETLALYAWGSELPELFGGWPGKQATGSVVKDGVSYRYFDTGEANKGLTYNLIFNNNNGGKQFDALAVTLDRDYYLRITDGSCEEIEPQQPIQHDGYAIFIEDGSAWETLALYAWGSELPELFGGWPGKQATGTVTIQGVTYHYFDTGKANEGLVYNIICNNNNAGQQFDLAQVTLNRHYYFRITASQGTEVEVPAGNQ